MATFVAIGFLLQILAARRTLPRSLVLVVGIWFLGRDTMRLLRPVGMNPDFGGITRPHSTALIKRQVKAMFPEPSSGSALILSTEEALAVIEERTGAADGSVKT